MRAGATDGTAKTDRNSHYWKVSETADVEDRWGHNVHRTLRDLTFGEVFTTGRPLQEAVPHPSVTDGVEETRETLETVTVKNSGNLVFTTVLAEIVGNVGIWIVK